MIQYLQRFYKTYLAPRSGMRGAVWPLPNTPSWCGTHLKHRDNFTSNLYNNIDILLSSHVMMKNLYLRL
jgi:hypothetical protein